MPLWSRLLFASGVSVGLFAFYIAPACVTATGCFSKIQMTPALLLR